MDDLDPKTRLWNYRNILQLYHSAAGLPTMWCNRCLAAQPMLSLMTHQHMVTVLTPLQPDLESTSRVAAV